MAMLALHPLTPSGAFESYPSRIPANTTRRLATKPGGWLRPIAAAAAAGFAASSAAGGTACTHKTHRYVGSVPQWRVRSSPCLPVRRWVLSSRICALLLHAIHPTLICRLMHRAQQDACARRVNALIWRTAVAQGPGSLGRISPLPGPCLNCQCWACCCQLFCPLGPSQLVSAAGSACHPAMDLAGGLC